MQRLRGGLDRPSDSNPRLPFETDRENPESVRGPTPQRRPDSAAPNDPTHPEPGTRERLPVTTSRHGFRQLREPLRHGDTVRRDATLSGTRRSGRRSNWPAVSLASTSGDQGPLYARANGTDRSREKLMIARAAQSQGDAGIRPCPVSESPAPEHRETRTRVRRVGPPRPGRWPASSIPPAAL